jgi:hypothetical protein
MTLRTPSRVGGGRLRTVALCGVACVAVGVAACTGSPTGATWTAVSDLSVFAAATVKRRELERVRLRGRR